MNKTSKLSSRDIMQFAARSDSNPDELDLDALTEDDIYCLLAVLAMRTRELRESGVDNKHYHNMGIAYHLLYREQDRRSEDAR